MKITLTGEHGEKYSYDFSNENSHAVIGRAGNADVQIKISPKYKVKEFKKTGNLGYLKETPEIMLVSKYHCELEFSDGKVKVRDLGSRNKTYVNDSMLNWESLELEDNSVLSLGEHCPLRVSLIERKSLLDKLKEIF